MIKRHQSSPVANEALGDGHDDADDVDRLLILSRRGVYVLLAIIYVRIYTRTCL